MIVIDFLKSESIKLPSEKYLTLVSCEIRNNSCGLHNLIVKIVNYPNDKITRFFLEIFKRYNTCLTESFWNITKAVYPWAIEILYIFCVQACIPEWVAESLWLIIKENPLKYLLEFKESFENPCFLKQDDFLWCMHICTRLRVFTMQFMHFLICIDFCSGYWQALKHWRGWLNIG